MNDDPAGELATPEEQASDLSPSDVTKILDGIEGALDRANEAREQGRRGETVPLDELSKQH